MIEVETDASVAETMRRIGVLRAGAVLTCEGEPSSMVSALIGAAILVCRDQPDVDGSLAVIEETIAYVRRRLADPTGRLP
jgi:hypothetical protein